jgi:hypothetical protein
VSLWPETNPLDPLFGSLQKIRQTSQKSAVFRLTPVIALGTSPLMVAA